MRLRQTLARPASTQSACWLDEQRKLGTRCLILDELPFPAARRQLVAVLVAGEDNFLQKSFASVSNENKVGFLALPVRIARKSQIEVVFPSSLVPKPHLSAFQS